MTTLTTTHSSSERSSILIIEIPGIEKLVDYLENLVHQDLNKEEIIGNFVTSLLVLDSNLFTMESVIIDLLFKFYHPSINQNKIKKQLKKMALRILKIFLNLGCYIDNKIPYVFNGLIFKDTVVLRKLTKKDVYVQ